MSQLARAVAQDLRNQKLDPDVVATVTKAIDENIPKRAYEVAIWFLGISAFVLVSGAVLALFKDKNVSEAYWVAVGAALGALAGLFNKSA